MLTDEAITDLAAFKARKKAQGESAMAALPGVSMVMSGERGSQFVISIASDDIAEAVCIGQLPHIHFELVGSAKNPVRRAAPNERKPAEKRAIDLTDDQINAVLDRWRAGQSAASLEFLPFVFDGTGRIKIR